jgi:hypothetical protein
MWYLIQTDYVYDIAAEQYPVNGDMGLFWVEGAEGAAKRDDKYINGQFEPRLSLDEAKVIKLGFLEQKRDDVIQDGIIVNNHPFYTDDKSISLMLQAITMEGLGIQVTFPRLWGLSNGTLYEISFAEIKDVAIAIAGKKDACYGNYFALKAQIIGAADYAALEAIDINAGWPQ